MTRKSAYASSKPRCGRSADILRILARAAPGTLLASTGDDDLFQRPPACPRAGPTGLTHLGINRAELEYIEAGGGLVAMDEASAGKPSTFRWANIKQLLTNRMLLGIYLGQYCINVLTYFFVTWFPIYLVKERGLSILDAGFAAAAPALCGFVGGLVGGYGSDWLLKRTGSLDIAHKTPLLIGMLLASLIIACVYIEQEWLVVTVMAVAFFGKGIASLGWPVISDLTSDTPSLLESRCSGGT